MCDLCTARFQYSPIARRSVLRMLGAAAAGFAISQCAPVAIAAPPAKLENVLSPDAALDRLMKGNARYVEGVSRRHDFKHEREALSMGQNPFAAVLSCADSRVAPEYCFDTARGDLFVCRVAGNFASDDIIASFEYAVQVLNTPLIMVLGHESCGAVEATIKSMKGATTLPGHLPTLVTALSPAVKAVQDESGDLLGNAIRSNVTLAIEKLRMTAPILKSSIDEKKLRVIGGIYQLKSGRVETLA
jgi:carbonic anhydrase